MVCYFWFDINWFLFLAIWVNRVQVQWTWTIIFIAIAIGPLSTAVHTQNKYARMLLCSRQHYTFNVESCHNVYIVHRHLRTRESKWQFHGMEIAQFFFVCLFCPYIGLVKCSTNMMVHVNTTDASSISVSIALAMTDANQHKMEQKNYNRRVNTIWMWCHHTQPIIL